MDELILNISDIYNIEEEFIKLLIEKKLTISVAESLTGGRLSDILTNVSGASNCFRQGYIVYQNIAKENVLNISPKLLEQYGAVSFECYKKMCEETYKLTNTDIVIATTGNAGPNSMEGKKVRLVYIGINFKNNIYIKECLFNGKRNDIKNLTVFNAINLAKSIIINN